MRRRDKRFSPSASVIIFCESRAGRHFIAVESREVPGLLRVPATASAEGARCARAERCCGSPQRFLETPAQAEEGIEGGGAAEKESQAGCERGGAPSSPPRP